MIVESVEKVSPGPPRLLSLGGAAVGGLVNHIISIVNVTIINVNVIIMMVIILILNIMIFTIIAIIRIFAAILLIIAIFAS